MKKVGILLIIIIIVAAGIIFYFKSPKKTSPEITHYSDHPAIKYPEVAGRRVVKRIELLEPKKAYNFKLINMDKKEVSLEDFRGKVVLVGFVYTNCPDVCGLITMHFRRIQREFEDIVNKDLVLILITTDPERDTPERNTYYTQSYGGEWYFLTGEEEELKETWKNYRVLVQPKKEVEIVYHTYMVALIDRRGYIRYRYVGLVDPKEIIVKDIKKLLKERG